MPPNDNNSHRTAPSRARRRSRPAQGALMLIAALLWPAAGLAQRDGVADALAGHQAEMNQLAGKDPMRRTYFFDPVAVEGPNPGVPCDHIARRRPDAVAGQGSVVLLESTTEAGRREM